MSESKTQQAKTKSKAPKAPKAPVTKALNEAKAQTQTVESFLSDLVDSVELIGAGMMKLQNEKVGMDSKQIQDTVYGIYSEALSIIGDCKTLTTNLRKSYKIKEADVKKWIEDNDSDSESDSGSESDEDGPEQGERKDNVQTEVKVQPPPLEVPPVHIEVVNPVDENGPPMKPTVKPDAPMKPKRGRPPGKKNQTPVA